MLAPLLLAAALAAADSALPVPADDGAVAIPSAVPGPPRMFGYIQFRSTYQDGPGLTNSLNRARLGAEGALPQHIRYRVLVELEAVGIAGTTANVSLRDAYMKWTHGPFAVTGGQYKTPFSRSYLMSITALETADRAMVVDTLAPKRDIGLMAEYTDPWVTLSTGVFNGEGQNIGVSRDSSSLLVSRAVVHLLPGMDLGADGAWNGERWQRYGLEADLEWRGALLRGEWIGQRRPGPSPDDHGWYVLGAYRVRPGVQLHAQQEDFERTALGVRRRSGATTVGAGLDLPGGRNRIILECVARRAGTPSVTHEVALAQWQVRF